MIPTLPKRDIVLVGAGHTNAHVLRMWRMTPFADVRLTCVTDRYLATYSGMLPGTLAGYYPPERMQIDLVRLCAAAGVRLLKGEVSGIDLDRQELLIAERPPVPFDVLSIGIGSVPRMNGLATDAPVLLIKPMQTFLTRLDERLAEAAAKAVGRDLSIAVVGAGAGGIEVAFCLPRHVERMLGRPIGRLILVEASQDLGRGMTPRTGKLIRREFERRGAEIVLGQTVQAVDETGLTLGPATHHSPLATRHVHPGDGRRIEADLVIWATGATAPDLLPRLGLPVDESGFLLTHRTLRTIADRPVFAVGDSGTIQEESTPKAGVYAVRQGPILWENLGRELRGIQLVDYRPQRSFLKLLATGDGRAILSRRRLAFHAGWCWGLKQRIDERFMEKYQDYTPRAPSMTTNPRQPVPMRCTGCGGKVSGSVLGRVLARLEIPRSEHVLLGLDTPDDAAIVQPTEGRPVVVTADFFTAFLDDPYLVGRVAALNAASDLFAKGAQPVAALALATIPVGPPAQQEQLLYELLAGAIDEFRRMGATLVGGHTIEGPQVTIGFAMLADGGGVRPALKSGLRVGDHLVLTKPLGTGVLLAALAQARLKAEWFEPLPAWLVASNQAAARVAREFEVAGNTDVTGFGLAGHLLEMLRASRLAAEIKLDSVPVMPGAEDLVQQGIESTIVPGNRAVESEIELPAWLPASHPRYALLFDPQTSGGLLLGVEDRYVKRLIAKLANEHGIAAAPIGRVTPQKADRRRLVIG